MRVLHLITWLVPGGIEKWLLSMLQEMPRDTCEMDVACKGVSTGPLAHVALEAGAKVIHCPLTPTHAGFVRELKRILREGNYDVVHNHLGNYAGIATWICQREGIPSIASFHNTAFPPETWTRLPGLRQLRDVYSRPSMSYGLKNSDIVTGCSEAVLESMTAYAPRKENWRVLPYGVEVPPQSSEEERRALRAELGWPDDALVVLHVGRFVEQKNHPGLLDIFARVVQEVPSARLLLVGDGPLRGEVDNLVIQRGLQDKVRSVGVRSDVPELMSRSDLFLFPSLHEGFGLVAIEANGAGIPVVGSRIPGLTEAVTEDTARLHAADDNAGMAASTIELLQNSALRQQMGEAGRQRVCRYFTRPASAENLLRLYRDCLAAHNRSTPSPK